MEAGAGRAPRRKLMRALSWMAELIGTLVPVLLLGVVIIVVATDVISRTVFSAPIFGASEVAVLAFVWLVWLGAVGVAKRDDLLGVRYFVDLLPHRAKHLVDAAVDLLTALIAAGTLYAAVMQIRTARFTTFTSIGVPKWLLSVGLSISMAFIVALFMMKAVRKLNLVRSVSR
jgi:TRAP-type transport system small permease protein